MTDHAQRARELQHDIEMAIIRVVNAAFDCGAWDSDERVKYSDRLEVSESARKELKRIIAAALDQAAQPVWRTGKPTMGNWWYRHDDFPERIVAVWEENGVLLAGIPHSGVYFAVNSVGGEWAGPLTLPREAQDGDEEPR